MFEKSNPPTPLIFIHHQDDMKHMSGRESLYPLVNDHIAGWNIPIFNRKYIFFQGSFSITMSVYPCVNLYLPRLHPGWGGRSKTYLISSSTWCMISGTISVNTPTVVSLPCFDRFYTFLVTVSTFRYFSLNTWCHDSRLPKQNLQETSRISLYIYINLNIYIYI